MQAVLPTRHAHFSKAMLLFPLLGSWRQLVIASLLCAAIGFGATYIIDPTYTAQTVLLPPERPQSASAAALQSLGALSALIGTGTSKTPTDQFAAMLQSTTVRDRLIDQFKLLEVYDEDYKIDARRELDKRVRISVGKKDGLLTIEVDRQFRAIDIAPRNAGTADADLADFARGHRALLFVQNVGGVAWQWLANRHGLAGQQFGPGRGDRCLGRAEY